MKKLKSILKNIFINIRKFLSSNIQFISYIILMVLELSLLRWLTIGISEYGIAPIIFDFAFTLIIGSFAYLFRPKNQYKYLLTLFIIVTTLCVINAVYYTFYTSFVSVGMMGSLGQVSDVGDAVLEKMSILHFVYILFPLMFFVIHKILNAKNYINYFAKIEKSKMLFSYVLLVGSFIMCRAYAMLNTNEVERFTKQWNREVIVESFGLLSYTYNDVYQTLSPKINSLFGLDEAKKDFFDFYCSNKRDTSKNKYTNKFKGYNIIFIHLESMQNFIVNLNVLGNEIAPNVNRLVKEGMYFSHFYPQVSVGTSSDTEFTLNTSLMPALSGAVFTSYYDRTYESLEHILTDKGYYTFSMHANKASMWNRGRMHQNLGYQEFYSKDYYVIDEEIGLGLSDSSFFRQSIPYLQNIEKNHKNFMGTILMLSNHTPFDDVEHYLPLDLSANVTITDENGNKSVQKIDYLEGRKMGNYLKSVHYADNALGEFFKAIEDNDMFDNTLFVLYGDHEAKISKSEFNYLYNFDLSTGKMKDETDPTYVNYDYYANELNKNTPLILWTKNKKLSTKVDYPMGMIDVLPTLANMIGINTTYSLGNDIFNVKDDNVVIFPNGNFLTNKIYYNSSKNEYKVLTSDVTISENYITELKDYTDTRLKISNDIIVYDLIAKYGEGLGEYCEK